MSAVVCGVGDVAAMGGARTTPRARVAVRGRAAAALAVVAIAGALVLSGGGDVVRSPEVGRTPVVVVGPGDTLWEIAQRTLPEGSSVGTWAHAIAAANDIDPLRLPVGATVRLPR